MGVGPRLSGPSESEHSAQTASEEGGGVSSPPEPQKQPVVTTAREPERKPVEERREDLRAKLAGGFAILFGLMVAGIFASALFGGDQWERMQEFVQIAFGTVAGIVGTIVGFYFGSQR